MVCRGSWNRMPLNKEDINRPGKRFQISNGPHEREGIMLFTPGFTVHGVQPIQAFKSFSLPLDGNLFPPFLNFTLHYNARTHRCPVFHRSGGKQALYNEFMAGWWRLLVENTLFICDSKGELKQFGCLLTSPPTLKEPGSAVDLLWYFPSTAFKLCIERW